MYPIHISTSFMFRAALHKFSDGYQDGTDGTLSQTQSWRVQFQSCLQNMRSLSVHVSMKSMCHSCSTKRQTSLLVAILDYSSFFRASTYTPYESSAKYAFHCRQTWLSLFSFINSKPLDETFSGSLWRNGALHEIACLTIGNLVVWKCLLCTRNWSSRYWFWNNETLKYGAP